MGLSIKNWYFGRSLKNPTFRGGSSRKADIEGGFSKKGGGGGGGGLARKKGVVFLRGGWYPDAHYANMVVVPMVVQTIPL